MVSKSLKNVDAYMDLVELEKDYKENSGLADNDIDTIRSINRNLWNKLDNPRVFNMSK